MRADLECLAVGAVSPLTGFMGRADYECVLKEMRLLSGLPWTLPITLAAGEEELENLAGSENIVLKSPAGETLAILHLEEVFPYDRQAEARHVYRTEDTNHPGVAELAAQPDHLLGGRITVLALPAGRPFENLRFTPAQVREEMRRRGWKTIAGFQTRQPIHRAHEYHTKVALETIDGLLLHPMVSEGKGEDFPAHVRMAAYETLLGNFYPPGRVLLSQGCGIPRHLPEELRMHPLHRRPRPRRLCQLLRIVRGPPDLRGVHRSGAGHNPAAVRSRLLVQPVRPDDHGQNLPALPGGEDRTFRDRG
jgi:sulfate adenylyltransferase